MSSDKQKSLLYCSLLALQFGLQPMIASRFTASGVSKSSVVIATELGKILIAIFTFVGESSTERQKIIETWSFKNSLMVAALPATLYAIQNVLVQHGYQLLDSMTFNLLNQTKVRLVLYIYPYYYPNGLSGSYSLDFICCILVMGSNGKASVCSSSIRSVVVIASRLV